MRFTVVWYPSALDELVEIWIQKPDQDAITSATHAIDRELAASPETKGEEFYGDWLFVAEPLAVTFTIRAHDRIVEILQVWHRSPKT